VVIGNRSFTVEQAGMIRTRIAVSPGRVVVGLLPKRPPGKREILIWTDTPSSSIGFSPTEKWIRVEADRSRKDGRRRLLYVTVDPASLYPGARNEGAIIISAEGAPPLTVPVLVEGISHR
jgi:hypothetical protein